MFTYAAAPAPRKDANSRLGVDRRLTLICAKRSISSTRCVLIRAHLFQRHEKYANPRHPEHALCLHAHLFQRHEKYANPRLGIDRLLIR